MKISVIIPCYNTGKYLKDTFTSLINQTYTNWEAIIIDDGSTDNTKEIAEKFKNTDSRFKYYFQKNEGLSAARNKGLELKTGNYVQFLDSDDVISNDKFEKSIAYVDTEDIIITNFQLFSDNPLKPTKPYCDLSKINFDYYTLLTKWDIDFTFPPHCCLISSDLIGNTRFVNELKAKEDWVFWLDLFKKKPKIKYLNNKLVFYRIHENNMTKNYKHMNKNLAIACKHIYNNLDDKYKKSFYDRIVNDYITEKSKADYLFHQITNVPEGSYDKAQLKRIKKAITYKTILKLELFLRGIKKISRTPK